MHSPDISPCGFDLISKIEEPIRGKMFATREDIANAVRQQVIRFTHGAANAKADGIQRFPHHALRVVTVDTTLRVFKLRTWVVERGKFYYPVWSLLKSKNQEINRLQLAVKLPWAIFFESVDILS
ncbi:hypothetical protein TNCV_760461 [Trichonephila clavipes]|nr:hypothetical protein TNCV_760461 [Trichonephila clavipes]